MVFLCGNLGSVEIDRSCLNTIKSFFVSFQSGDAEKAINEMMSAKLKWAGRDDINKMVSTLQKMNADVLGNYYGCDIIHFSTISKDFFVVVAMAKFERQPVFFRFSFYRPDKQFVIDSFNMNTTVFEVQKEWLMGKNELKADAQLP